MYRTPLLWVTLKMYDLLESDHILCTQFQHHFKPCVFGMQKMPSFFLHSLYNLFEITKLAALLNFTLGRIRSDFCTQI